LAIIVVARGNSPDTFVATEAGRDKQIAHGQPFDIEVKLHWPVAWVADLSGVEGIANSLYTVSGAVLKDTFARDARTIVLRCESNSFRIVNEVLGAIWRVISRIFSEIGELLIAVSDAALEIVKAVGKVASWGPYVVIAVIGIIAFLLFMAIVKNPGNLKVGVGS